MIPQPVDNLTALDNLLDAAVESVEKRGLEKTQEIAVIGIILTNTLEHAGLPKASRHVKALLEELLEEVSKGGCKGGKCHGK